MPVPLQSWSSWVDATPALAPHRSEIGAAVEELSRRHPARRAFWGDDLAWELGAAGLRAPIAELVTQASEALPVLRIEVNPHAPADRPAPGEVPSVLLASSPRAGNTFLRRLLVQLGFAEYALHDLDDMHWSAATRPFVVQHHAPPSETTAQFLAAQDARPLTIVRHPLDVLCSVRVFAQRFASTRYWLEGSVELVGADLASDDGFAAWALGDGAARLLEVSTGWALDAGATTIRYEEMAAEPATVLQDLAAAFGSPADPDADPATLVARAAEEIPELHRTAGRPGAWRQLPTDLADRLAQRHERHLVGLGYQAGS